MPHADPLDRPRRALLVYPRFNPASFWNYQATCEVLGARYPAAPLGLITVAALLPRDWELRLVNRNTEELTTADVEWADLVLTGGMQSQQPDTLRLIAMAQAQGKLVLVGGPDASSSPEVYAAADFLVQGEAEKLMADVVAAIERGDRRGRFRAERFPDVTRSPVPRFDLLKLEQYLHVGIQWSRGCPFNCEFCDIIELYGRVPRTKTPEQVLAELETLHAAGYRGHVDFVDDNLIGNKKKLKELLPRLEAWLEAHRWPFEFTTEATINLADDPELLALLRRTGFFAIFVGVESPDTDTLVLTQKKQNANRRLARDIDTIYRAGIWVNGGFIVGFDSERGPVADSMIACIEETAIPVCMVGLLYALADTQLSRRLQAEGRLHPNAYLGREDVADQCTAGLNFETLRPRAAILADYRRVLDRIYEPRGYFARVRRVALRLDRSAERYRPPLRLALRDLRGFLNMVWRLGVRGGPARWPWWRTTLETLIRNPRAIRQAGAMMALYLHLGPFSRHVIARIDAQLAALAEGRWQAPAPLPRPAAARAGRA